MKLGRARDFVVDGCFFRGCVEGWIYLGEVLWWQMGVMIDVLIARRPDYLQMGMANRPRGIATYISAERTCHGSGASFRTRIFQTLKSMDVNNRRPRFPIFHATSQSNPSPIFPADSSMYKNTPVPTQDPNLAERHGNFPRTRSPLAPIQP